MIMGAKMNTKTMLALVALCISASGCSLLGLDSGLDAKKSFACKAPAGISCSSLSGVYANAVADNLPGSVTNKSTGVYAKAAQQGIVGAAPGNGTPLLSTPSVLRVWVAPWEDRNKVLHDQAFLYAVADPGHWQIARSKKKIANQYRVLAPAAQQQPEPNPKAGQAQYELPQADQQAAVTQGQK